ncbi:acyltransferase family protein [Rhizomonospora bruguierae]|uniref:acyltransferase family protein n=1 Tax=Rhizomonospora bruguierae TaxID=1581705 RepID=UPI001BD0468D|nr:acyltransferase family protein [Micromonospora sp. NBRC 107566]
MDDRLPYLDRLKIVLVAGVIFGHAWAGYSTFQGAWAYTDAREVTLSPVTTAVLEGILGPFALFAMGMFFLIAGLLTPASVDRRAPGRYARERLRRLGLPLLVFTLLLWPPAQYILDRLTGRPRSPWATVTALDPVHLWFAEVLLVFSLGYAVLRAVPGRRAGAGAGPPTPITIGRLLGLSAVVAAGSFVVRGWFPLNTSGPLGLHLCQWPQFVALFALGVHAARAGWLANPVPDRLRRACGLAALVGSAAIAGFALLVAALGEPTDHFLGGWNPAALATAAAEGLLSVNLAVWLLGAAQRHLAAPLRFPALTRDAFAAYVVQGHVLVLLALLARPVPAPAEAKALVVSVGGVLGSFALGHLLAARGRAPGRSERTPKWSGDAAAWRNG